MLLMRSMSWPSRSLSSAGHGVVHDLADGGLVGLRLQVCPARLRWHPEDVERAVLVWVLWVSALCLLRFELRMLCLESVGDVFEEDQAEHDVLVLGSVHATAQRVGHLPEPRFVADD